MQTSVSAKPLNSHRSEDRKGKKTGDERRRCVRKEGKKGGREEERKDGKERN